MRNMLAFLSAVVILSLPPAWAGTVYKCKKTDGHMFYQETPCAKEAESVSSWASKSAPAMEDNAGTPSPENSTLVIGQSRGGHYFIDGAVNDVYLNFVIDTGATLVALPLATAIQAGVKCQKIGMMATGNGESKACSVTIQKLRFGQFTLRNVEAVVMPNLSQPLLGMNVLKQFRVEQDNGQMRLTRNY